MLLLLALSMLKRASKSRLKTGPFTCPDASSLAGSELRFSCLHFPGYLTRLVGDCDCEFVSGDINFTESRFPELLAQKCVSEGLDSDL